VGVTPAMILPFEPHLYGAAANNGQMLVEVQPKSQTAEGYLKLAQVVTGRAPSPESHKGSMPVLAFLKARKQA
jgi:pilus assembly protein CpaE